MKIESIFYFLGWIECIDSISHVFLIILFKHLTRIKIMNSFTLWFFSITINVSFIELDAFIFRHFISFLTMRVKVSFKKSVSMGLLNFQSWLKYWFIGWSTGRLIFYFRALNCKKFWLKALISWHGFIFLLNAWMLFLSVVTELFLLILMVIV